MSSEIETALKMYRRKLELARENVRTLEGAVEHLEAAQLLVSEAGTEAVPPMPHQRTAPIPAPADAEAEANGFPAKSARRMFARRVIPDIVNTGPLRAWNLKDLTHEVLERGMSHGASFNSDRETIRAVADNLAAEGAIGKPTGQPAVYYKAGFFLTLSGLLLPKQQGQSDVS